MKLKTILPHLDKIAKVVLWNTGVMINGKIEEEKVFEGIIMDIPWVYLDYFLDSDEEGEAIDVRPVYGSETNRCNFVICIKENKQEKIKWDIILIIH